MEQRVMTAEEVVKITINDLSRIQVPAALIQQIGIPIADAINKLNLCVESWERTRHEEESKQADKPGEAESE